MESRGRRQQRRRDPGALRGCSLRAVLFRPDEDFRPPRWLRNRHVQSMLASTSARRGSIMRRTAGVVTAEKEMLLDCGDGVRLQSFVSSPANSTGRPAIILHGWEGSAQSLYILSLAQQLFDRGFEVVRLNLRDHGETHHLNRELFHSCRLPEVIGAVQALQAHFPGRPLSGVGFSLGRNFLLPVPPPPRPSSPHLAPIITPSPPLE